MRLPLFYPLAPVVIGAMLFYALKPGVERALEWRSVISRIDSEGLTIQGEGLRAIVNTDRVAVEIGGSDMARMAVIQSSGAVTDEEVNGAHYTVPPEVVRRLRGQTVEIVFDQRADPRDEPHEWQVRVVLEGDVDTGWSALPSTEDWAPATFEVALPAGRRFEPLHLMMWSDAKGDGERIHLRSITVRPKTAGGGS